MSAPRLTGSGLERAAICPASAVLPHVQTVSEHAERGSQIHAFLEAVNAKGREAALAEVDDEIRPVCEALDVAKLPTDPSRFAAEVAFAYDTENGQARELGRGIGRAYDVTPTEIAGTADVIALLDDDGVFVADFKSGWSRRTAARESLQLRFYALCAARTYGRSRAVVQVIRLFEDGETWTDEAALDAFDLDAFALDLGALMSGIEADRKALAAGIEPEMVEGSHCKWCPAFSRCPAKVALVQLPPRVEITPDGAAAAYQRLRLYREALDKAEAILKDYARANPILLPDGTVYGPRYDSTKRLDGAVAAKVLRDLLGDKGEAGIEVEVTQASIKRALAAAGRPASDLKAVLDAIRERGGLRVIQAPKLIAHKPKEAA